MICAYNKSISYTNTSSVKLLHNDYYIDANGFARDNYTHDYIGALATQYPKSNRYLITLSNGNTFYFKNVDVKSDAHTTNNCYTTHDNSIVELWINNNNQDLKFLGNTNVVNVYVTSIKQIV